MSAKNKAGQDRWWQKWETSGAVSSPSGRLKQYERWSDKLVKKIVRQIEIEDLGLTA